LLTRGYNAFSYQHISSALGCAMPPFIITTRKRPIWAWR
jgi:hypothetical protein